MNRAPMADRIHGAVPRSAPRGPAAHGRPSAYHTAHHARHPTGYLLAWVTRILLPVVSRLVRSRRFAIISPIERLEPTRAPRRAPVWIWNHLLVPPLHREDQVGAIGIRRPAMDYPRRVFRTMVSA